MPVSATHISTLMTANYTVYNRCSPVIDKLYVALYWEQMFDGPVILFCQNENWHDLQ